MPIELDKTAQAALINMLSRMRACWEQGIAAIAMDELGCESAFLAMCDDMIVHQHADGCLAANETSTQTDPALCIRSMIRAHKMTGDTRYMEAAKRNLDYLRGTPWRSEAGVLYHFKGTRLLWADTAAMLPSSLAVVGEFDMASSQMLGLLDVLRLENGLYGHQWNDGEGRWDRRAVWSAGCGWILVGLAWTMEELHRNKRDVSILIKQYDALTEAMLPYRLPNGLYHDICDDPTSFVECQTACMQAYSQMVLYRCGLADGTCVQHSEHILHEIALHMDQHGSIQDSPGSPDFMHCGSSTEMQAFYLMLYAQLYHSKKQ